MVNVASLYSFLQVFLHSPVLCAGEEVERGSGAV